MQAGRLRPGCVTRQYHRQLFAGLDEAHALTLIFEGVRKVEGQPPIVLALIPIRRWATSRTIKVDAPWASSRPDRRREEFKLVRTVIDRPMDVGLLLSESCSGGVYMHVAATALEG